MNLLATGDEMAGAVRTPLSAGMDRFGGTEGNEILTSATAVVLTGLLAAEGFTVAGHKSDTLLLIHKVSFIVWGVVFAVHFLAYTPRVVRSLRTGWGAAGGEAVPGAVLRRTLVAATVGGGTALALALLPTMNAWRGGH